MNPKLTIAIATYNRGQALRRTLDSLAAMDAKKPEWELLVINNNCTDSTESVFAHFAALNPDIDARMVLEPNQGLSHARNRGVAEARGRYIALIDDDVEINASFATAYIDFFEKNPDAAAGGGKVIPLYETQRPEWMSRYTERPIAGTIDMGQKPRIFGRGYPTGANMAFRTDALCEIGGFDTSLGRNGGNLMGGEEKDLFARMKKSGGKIYYVPGAEVLHIIPESKLSPQYFLRVAHMCGRSERVRTMSVSRISYAKAVVREIFKWCATAVLAAAYTAAGHPAKAKALTAMRKEISRGLLGR